MNYSYKKSMKFCTLIILISLLPLHNIVAGAWTQKKGSGYYKTDFRYLSGNKIYNSVGDKVSIPDFTDITIGVFSSYGITNDFTIMINAAVYKNVKLDTTLTSLGQGNEISGFGDIIIGGKYKLTNFGKSLISGKLLINIPTGESSTDGGLWTGNGDFHQSLGFEYGYSFWPVPLYLNTGITYTNRTQGFSDEFRYGIESGYNFTQNLSLIVRFHGQISMQNGNENLLGGYGIYSNNQQYIAYNAELVYKFTNNFGIKGYYESGGAGENIVSAPVLNFGIFITN